MNRSLGCHAERELFAKFHRVSTIYSMAGKDRDRTVYKTQGEAIEAAKQTLYKQGGGELIVKGRDGRIRSKDTITPGRDPNPPRDREH